MDAEAGELLLRYESEMEKVRVQAGRDREKLRAETAALEAKIMGEARHDAALILERGKAQVAAEVAELKKDLDRARPALAAQIASRILGREVN